jgi:hypothetical protein
MTLMLESRMLGNWHVRFGGGELEKYQQWQLAGFLSYLEIGDTIQQAGPATRKLLDWMTDISQNLGFEMDALHHLGDFLTQAGCQAVEAHEIPVPLGEWAGTTGQMLKTDVLHGYQALKESYCARSQTPPEVFDSMVQAATTEWEERHAAYVFHAAYGRRTTP